MREPTTETKSDDPRLSGAEQPKTEGAHSVSRQSKEKFINRGVFYWWCWRAVMRLAHRHHWHYAKPIYLHGGDVQLWCQWCGFRDTIKRGPKLGASWYDALLRDEAENP